MGLSQHPFGLCIDQRLLHLGLDLGLGGIFSCLFGVFFRSALLDLFFGDIVDDFIERSDGGIADLGEGNRTNIRTRWHRSWVR